mmetsp:Transcript_31225/g.90745  ORF Transcript_31225/g.90745 Transcript_31225/m.90745 type:complete len:456 (+) Transcript_31225:1925-3292(+)
MPPRALAVLVQCTHRDSVPHPGGHPSNSHGSGGGVDLNGLVPDRLLSNHALGAGRLAQVVNVIVSVEDFHRGIVVGRVYELGVEDNGVTVAGWCDKGDKPLVAVRPITVGPLHLDVTDGVEAFQGALEVFGVRLGTEVWREPGAGEGDAPPAADDSIVRVGSAAYPLASPSRGDDLDLSSAAGADAGLHLKARADRGATKDVIDDEGREVPCGVLVVAVAAASRKGDGVHVALAVAEGGPRDGDRPREEVRVVRVQVHEGISEVHSGDVSSEAVRGLPTVADGEGLVGDVSRGPEEADALDLGASTRGLPGLDNVLSDGGATIAFWGLPRHIHVGGGVLFRRGDGVRRGRSWWVRSLARSNGLIRSRSGEGASDPGHRGHLHVVEGARSEVINGENQWSVIGVELWQISRGELHGAARRRGKGLVLVNVQNIVGDVLTAIAQRWVDQDLQVAPIQ